MMVSAVGARVLVMTLVLSGVHASGSNRTAGSWVRAQPAGARSSTSQVGATSEEKRAAAKAIVEKYWSGEAEDRYSLLAESYKLDLRRLGITNAAEYAHAELPERIWGKRTYQRVEVGRNTGQKRDVAQVVLLIDWEQEGYRGMKTYIFDLVAEAGRWSISNIVY